jgi:hemerythrin-like metal-binding protein
VEAEHEVQLHLVRALREGLEKGDDRASTSTLLRQLLDYSDAHFLSEQLLMRLYAYPAYEDHVGEHDRLVAELRSLAEGWERGEGASAAGLLARVEEWLSTHMATTDTALEAYLAEHGPRPA